MNEHTPILVAPRPVRIASESGASSYAMRSGTSYRRVSSVADHFERAKVGGEIDEQKATAFFDSSSGDKDLASTRSSPRSSLPSEALEEFLSILNPSFFPPSSPILRARRNGASLSNYPYQYRARVLHSRGDSVSLVEELDHSLSTTSAQSPECTLEKDETANDHERRDSETFRWFATSTLSSPISRMHTRNPFPVGLLRTNRSTPSPISPRAIPLPSPTPDEMIEVS